MKRFKECKTGTQKHRFESEVQFGIDIIGNRFLKRFRYRFVSADAPFRFETDITARFGMTCSQILICFGSKIRRAFGQNGV